MTLERSANNLQRELYANRAINKTESISSGVFGTIPVLSTIMSTDDSINGLAAQVSELASGFTKSLADANVPEPNFTSQSPTSYDGQTAEMFLHRQELLDKIMDMWYLVQGPSESVFNYVHTVSVY